MDTQPLHQANSTDLIPLNQVKDKLKKEAMDIESGEIVTSNDITPCKVEVKEDRL